MKFTAIQGNLDTYMYYFRLLVVNLGTYYIFLKIINGQKNRLANIIKMFFIFLVTFINLYVNVVTNNLTGTMITLLLLIVLFDKVGYNTTSYTIISFGISNLIFFLSVMISGIPGVLFRVYNFNISLVIIITIYILLLFFVIFSFNYFSPAFWSLQTVYFHNYHMPVQFSGQADALRHLCW
mgnify:CR=1 FL=1